MKNFRIVIASLLFLVAPALVAQTLLTNTTFSTAGAATGGPAGRCVVVSSATGITAPSTTDNTKQTFLWVDRELIDVQSVNGTTVCGIRGAEGTFAQTHTTSAPVFVIPANKATAFRLIPHGSCTRANELLLPRIHYATGVFSDCDGGQWVSSDAYQTIHTLDNLLRLPEPGATALTALETAGTAPAAATEIYCTELEVPKTMLLTGIASLNGTTVATDKHWVILYDSAGAVLANSATAGATTSGASTYQKFNFVNKFLAVGPARYFGCVGSNGTTDTIRHAITAVNDNVLGGTVTAQVFGTAAAITVPSSFTTAKVPYLAVF